MATQNLPGCRNHAIGLRYRATYHEGCTQTSKLLDLAKDISHEHWQLFDGTGTQ